MGRVGRRVLLAATLTLCAASVGACGGDSTIPADGKAFQAAFQSCDFMGSRVRVGDSGITCAEANAVRLLLADLPENPQVIEARDGRWRCWRLPPKQLPVTLRCEQGGRSFTVEDAAGR